MSAPPRDRGEWRGLAPLGGAVAPTSVSDSPAFLQRLVTRQAPDQALQPLRHDRSPQAPAGLVVGVARTIAPAVTEAAPLPGLRPRAADPLHLPRAATAGSGMDFFPPEAAAPADTDVGVRAAEPVALPDLPEARRLTSVADAGGGYVSAMELPLPRSLGGSGGAPETPAATPPAPASAAGSTGTPAPAVTSAADSPASFGSTGLRVAAPTPVASGAPAPMVQRAELPRPRGLGAPLAAGQRRLRGQEALQATSTGPAHPGAVPAGLRQADSADAAGSSMPSAPTPMDAVPPSAVATWRPAAAALEPVQLIRREAATPTLPSVTGGTRPLSGPADGSASSPATAAAADRAGTAARPVSGYTGGGSGSAARVSDGPSAPLVGRVPLRPTSTVPAADPGSWGAAGPLRLPVVARLAESPAGAPGPPAGMTDGRLADDMFADDRSAGTRSGDGTAYPEPFPGNGSALPGGGLPSGATGPVGTGSVGTGPAGTGPAGTGPVGTGSADTDSVGTGSAGTAGSYGPPGTETGSHAPAGSSGSTGSGSTGAAPAAGAASAAYVQRRLSSVTPPATAVPTSAPGAAEPGAGASSALGDPGGGGPAYGGGADGPGPRTTGTADPADTAGTGPYPGSPPVEPTARRLRVANPPAPTVGVQRLAATRTPAPTGTANAAWGADGSASGYPVAPLPGRSGSGGFARASAIPGTSATGTGDPVPTGWGASAPPGTRASGTPGLSAVDWRAAAEQPVPADPATTGVRAISRLALQPGTPAVGATAMPAPRPVAVTAAPQTPGSSPVQRLEADSPAQNAGESAAVAPAVPAASAEPVAAAAPAAAPVQDPAELAEQLYDHIAGRLRRELLIERERSYLLVDR